MDDNDKLAKGHAEMRAFVLSSMPPEYYNGLTQFQKELIDSVIDLCFRWHRSELFQQFIDQSGGLSELVEKMRLEADPLDTEPD